MTPVDDDPPRHCGALYGMLAFVVVAVGGGAAGWVIGWIMDRLSR